MKLFKTPLIAFIVTIALITSSCSKEDDGIYFHEVSTIEVQYSEMEMEILDLVNNYRNENGLESLNTMNIISSVAESHSSYMVENNVVNHDNFGTRQSILFENAKAKSVGENVAYGYSTAKAVVNAWIKSDAHRKILESKSYTHFGISIKENEEGRYYFTHMFIKR